MISKRDINPKVSIIILNWNRYDDICNCLESVYKLDYPNFDVIVVDNASTYGSPEKIKEKFPEVIMLKNKENMGFTGGNNIGMRYAIDKGVDYVWLLNNDTVVSENALTALILDGEKLRDCGLLSPVIYDYSNPKKMQNCGVMDMKNFSVDVDHPITPNTPLKNEKQYLMGTALLIKREVIQKIGYLDEKMFAYHEDNDISLRAERAGYSNKVVLSARIWHKHYEVRPDSRSTRKMPAHKIYYMTRNEYFFWIKYLSPIERIFFIRKYIARSLRTAGHCKENGFIKGSSVCLDGLCCAFRSIGGRFKDRKQVPRFIKKLILWHPYFVADILDAKFTHILNKFGEKITNKRRIPYAKS